MSFLVACIIVIVCAVNAQLQLMNLILFPNNTEGGQCMDGSPAGFYYSPPPSGSSNLWVVMTKNHVTNEQKHLKVHQIIGHQPTMQSNDPSVNPDFYTGHKILCYYCSSDEWCGPRTKPSLNPDTWGYIFGGHLIFKLIIQYAVNNLNDSILDAEYVFLAGNSAGGAGLFANVEWLGQELKQKGRNKNLVYKASPRSGWFFSWKCNR
eukprot:541743_1